MIPIGSCPYCSEKIYALNLRYCPNCGAVLKGSAKELDQARVLSLYQQAEAAAAEDEWSEAILRLIDALKLDPENETTKEKLEKARHQYHLARQFEWAQEHYFARHLDDALKNLREIEQEDPGNAEVLALVQKIEAEKTHKDKKLIRKARRRLFFNEAFSVSYYLLMIAFLLILALTVFLLLEASIH
ncbi:MAG: hypothetical protein JW750_01610 [Anaerolineaceae bacterium]|nr:hypothetical protein [Anaerolineaceae bacterium]